MRKLLFVAAIALFTMSACKKSDSNNPVNTVGTLSVNIDGTVTSFGNSAMAQNITSGGLYSLTIFGFQGTAGASNQMTMQVTSESPITAKAYAENGTGTDEVGLGLHEYATSTTWSNNGSTTNPLTITITSITTTNVQGTFSGLITNTGGSGTKTLSSGTFNLNF